MVQQKDIRFYYSYDEIHGLVRKISDDIVGDGVSIDVIVGIATGGWFPARMLRTFLPYEGEYPMPL